MLALLLSIRSTNRSYLLVHIELTEDLGCVEQVLVVINPRMPNLSVCVLVIGNRVGLVDMYFFTLKAARGTLSKRAIQ